MRIRGSQPDRRKVEQDRRTQACAVEQDPVDDPRRDEDDGESRPCT